LYTLIQIFQLFFEQRVDFPWTCNAILTELKKLIFDRQLDIDVNSILKNCE